MLAMKLTDAAVPLDSVKEVNVFVERIDARRAHTDVELVDGGGYTVQCRINGTLVTLPALFMLPGTTVWSRGDRGTLVMPRQVAAELGLA